MNAPTEPGHYWWIGEGHAPIVVEVDRFPDGMLVVVGPSRTGAAWCIEMQRFLAGAKGAFGPRIPGPEQLEAMHELASADAEEAAETARFMDASDDDSAATSRLIAALHRHKAARAAYIAQEPRKEAPDAQPTP